MRIKALFTGFGILWLGAVFAMEGNAQTLSILHNFAVPAQAPDAPLVQGPDGTLSGTSSAGGDGGSGTVFKVRPDGTGFTNLYNFDGGLDGGTPYSGLVLSGSLLYGTTSAGGGGGNGTLFMLDTNGGNFNLLWDFSEGSTNSVGTVTNADGAAPQSGLVLSGGALFGTTFSGGTWGNGVVFMVSTNGGGLTPLWEFSAGDTNAAGIWTNAEGATPEAALVVSGTNLFGTTYQGGTGGSGTVFELATNGGTITVLKTFSAADPNTGTNSDGAFLYAGLTLSGTTLFGTTEGGGPTGDGTVFALYNLGAKFSVLWTFSATDANTGTNVDGAFPDGALAVSGNFLFGTTYEGGFHGNGIVFMLNTNGGQFTNVHSFARGSDGANPVAGLLVSGTALLGTASAGGSWDAGTFFSVNTNAAGFTNFQVFASGDGVEPLGGLLLAGNTFYGMAAQGGVNNTGLVFKMSTNGGGFAVLRSFTAVDPNTGTNSDGAYPQGNLVLSGGTLFGTTSGGGTNGNGTVFAISTNGTGFNVLWSGSAGETNAFGLLTNANGAYPETGLTLSGNTLFGTTYEGSVIGVGTVFSMNTNGSGFKVLTHFSVGNYDAAGNWTNADGANPAGTLVLAGTNLYGVAYQGGSRGDGAVFRIGTNGGTISILKTFSATDPDTGTNTDGADPYAGLTLSGTTLYGTAESGGVNGSGTVFALGTNGGNFSVLWNFSAPDGNTDTNTDGANPDGGLLLSSNTLFGTTSAGGYWGGGSIFEINTNASGFANLQSFVYATDGDSPYANLILSGNALVGATSEGGVLGGGTIFQLTTAITSPALTITASVAGATLSWPSPSLGFVLQQSSNLAATNWVAFPGSVFDNGILKNAIVTPPPAVLFFRLYHP